MAITVGQMELPLDSLPAISGVQPNVYVDSDGVFYRIQGA